MRLGIHFGRCSGTYFTIEYPNFQAILGVFLTQRFRPDKPFLPRCADRDILAAHYFIPTFFKCLQQFIERIDGVYQPVDCLPYLLLPRFAILPLLPFIVADRPSLVLKVQRRGHTECPAYTVYIFPCLPQRITAGVIFLP